MGIKALSDALCLKAAELEPILRAMQLPDNTPLDRRHQFYFGCTAGETQEPTRTNAEPANATLLALFPPSALRLQRPPWSPARTSPVHTDFSICLRFSYNI